jgi:hypothetical protein
VPNSVVLRFAEHCSRKRGRNDSHTFWISGTCHRAIHVFVGSGKNTVRRELSTERGSLTRTFLLSSYGFMARHGSSP